MRRFLASSFLVLGLYAVSVLTTWLSAGVAHDLTLLWAAPIIGAVFCGGIAVVTFVVDKVGRG